MDTTYSNISVNETLFPKLREIIGDKESPITYFDQQNNQSYELKYVIVVVHSAKLWLSTFRNVGERCHFRPIVLTDNNDLVLLSVPTVHTEVIYSKLICRSHDSRGLFPEWYIISIDHFREAKFPRMINLYSGYKQYEYMTDWIKDHNLIPAADPKDIVCEEDQQLYARFLYNIGARWSSFGYRLESNLHLIKINGNLYYYFDRIYGCVSNKEFDIMLKNGHFVFVKGDKSVFLTIFEIAEIENIYFPQYLKYIRIYPEFIGNVIHEWMMNGCPLNNDDIKYKISGWLMNISLDRIIFNEITLDFVPRNDSYICIENKLLDKDYTFTNNPEFSHAHSCNPNIKSLTAVSNFVKFPSKDKFKSWIMTDQDKIEAKQILTTIISNLDSSFKL